MAAGPGRLGHLFFLVIAEPTVNAAGRHGATAAHLAYLEEITASGHLFLAGPMADASGQSTGGGMFLLRAGSEAEAGAIAARDPYNAGGYRTFRVQPWRIDQGGFSLTIDLSSQSLAFR